MNTKHALQQVDTRHGPGVAFTTIAAEADRDTVVEHLMATGWKLVAVTTIGQSVHIKVERALTQAAK